MKFKTYIGMEIHVELSTKSGMFCACPADHFAEEPNTNTCPVCLGLPGALPIANQKAIEDTIKFGLAFGCDIANFSKFDRKHYFYPDLPKAYQISQYDMPLCKNGELTMPSGKTVRLTRIHLEEDTGKSVHKVVNGLRPQGAAGSVGKKVTLIDFNRSGVPLMEMVTEPDFDNTEDVIAFLKEVQLIVRYLKISDADMEKGSMRLEANLSVAVADKDNKFSLPDYKIELKNINSFRFLKKAMDYEIQRHQDLLAKGEKIKQETRGYDEVTEATFSQRSKEEAKDYRYFPDPDIPPIRIENTTIEAFRKTLPEFPSVIRKRLRADYSLSDDYIEFLVSASDLVKYFETCVSLDKNRDLGPKTIAGAMVNQKMHEEFPEPAGLVKKLIEVTKREYASVTDTQNAIDEVINANEDAVKQYQEGKGEIVGFLIGQTQKILKGLGDPKVIRENLTSKLQTS